MCLIFRTILVWMYLNYYHRSHSNMGWWQQCLVGDFPGRPVVKNLPANVGDMGSIPGPGRSHMPWSNQVSEPQLLSQCSATREYPLLTTLKKAWVQQRRPSTAIKQFFLKSIWWTFHVFYYPQASRIIECWNRLYRNKQKKKKKILTLPILPLFFLVHKYLKDSLVIEWTHLRKGSLFLSYFLGSGKRAGAHTDPFCKSEILPWPFQVQNTLSFPNSRYISASFVHSI